MKQVGPIRMSDHRPTLVDCLCELKTLIMWDHGDNCIFTVLPGQGIKQCEKRVAVWIARELPKAKSGVLGCVQTRDLWSTEEEVHMRPGHH